MSRYLNMEQYNNTTEEFKKEYQKWWIDNLKIGDLFWLCDEDKHDLSELHCVTSELVLDVTKRNYGNVRIGIPTLETLIDFIEYKTKCKIEIVYCEYSKESGYGIYLWTETFCIFKRYNELGKDLKTALLKAAERICKE